MAKLEARTEIRKTRKKPDAIPRDFHLYFPLTVGRELGLGQSAAHAECAVPHDEQVSRLHALVVWDGARLAVRERPVSAQYPNAPANRIRVPDRDQKPAADGSPPTKEVRECAVGLGEPFWIGQTRFVVRADDEPEAADPFEGTVAAVRESRTRAELEQIPFSRPADALKAMEQLHTHIKAATDEPGLYRQLLRVAMEALPRADAAAIVRAPADASKPVELVESNVRHNRLIFGPDGFRPSHKLSRLAVREGKSCIHCWTTEAAENMTLAARYSANEIPWALCAPFQDGSRAALYVTGRVDNEWTAAGALAGQLTEYQKLAEMLTGLIETALRGYRLARQNLVIRQAWPRGIWKHLEDADRLAALLKPQEKEVTILFCDLRNYSQFASRHADDLLPAWGEVSRALETMSGTVTLLDGIVAGFRGDAILAFWGWPDPQERQLEKAAQAALTIHAKLAHQDKQCGLALTHGTAVAGRLGAHDLAVVDLYGPVVNLAFRLEAMTKAFGAGVIVTAGVAERLAASATAGGEMRTRALGRVRAKGFPDPIAAFELYSAHAPNAADTLPREWGGAVGAFTAGEWPEANRQLSDFFPTDPVARCLLRVINRLGRSAPPDWDGSFVPLGPDEK